MSLVKIPMVIIITATSLKLSASPNPIPRKENSMVSTTTMDKIGDRNIFSQYIQFGYIFIAGAEVASILAAARLSHPLSEIVLSATMLRSEDAARIRMTPNNTIGAIIFFFGAIMRLRAFHDLGRFFRYTIGVKKDHKLITTGIYAYVRHPSYTGLWIANIGWTLWSFGVGSWGRGSGLWDLIWARIALACFFGLVAFFPVMTVLRIEMEERVLKDKFGKEWDEWAKKVPYRLIPGVY